MSADGHGSGHDDEVHEEHEEHVNHEAWVIPYADLLTLLMADRKSTRLNSSH